MAYPRAHVITSAARAPAGPSPRPLAHATPPHLLRLDRWVLRYVRAALAPDSIVDAPQVEQARGEGQLAAQAWGCSGGGWLMPVVWRGVRGCVLHCVTAQLLQGVVRAWCARIACVCVQRAGEGVLTQGDLPLPSSASRGSSNNARLPLERECGRVRRGDDG